MSGLSLVSRANLATLLLKVPDSDIENHAYVLGDPENPLILAVATKSAHGQFVKIYWGEGKNPARQLAAQLEKNGRAKVYDLSFDFRSDVLHPESKKVLIGPKLVDVDFSVYKNFPVHRISESFNVQFRAELFNVLNHTNFAPPINNVAVLGAIINSDQTSATKNEIIGTSKNPTAGLLDRTTSTSRQIQFGLKFAW